MCYRVTATFSLPAILWSLGAFLPWTPELLRVENTIPDRSKINVYFLQKYSLWVKCWIVHRHHKDKWQRQELQTGDKRRATRTCSIVYVTTQGREDGRKNKSTSEFISLWLLKYVYVEYQQSVIMHMKWKCSYLCGAFQPENPKVLYKLYVNDPYTMSLMFYIHKIQFLMAKISHTPTTPLNN